MSIRLVPVMHRHIIQLLHRMTYIYGRWLWERLKSSIQNKTYCHFVLRYELYKKMLISTKNYWDERINHDDTWELIKVIESLKGYYDTGFQFVGSALFGMVTLLRIHNPGCTNNFSSFFFRNKKIYTSFICRVYRSFLKGVLP